MGLGDETERDADVGSQELSSGVVGWHLQQSFPRRRHQQVPQHRLRGSGDGARFTRLDLPVQQRVEGRVVQEVTRAVLPGMRARGGGCIINMSSVAGLTGVPGFGFYTAAKFAIERLTEVLRHEVAPLGIKVLAVEPGAFRTRASRNGRLALTAPLACAVR